jgi:hypothetical protein
VEVVFSMFFLYDSTGCSYKFETIAELKEFIETGHAERGGFDWISEIKDDKDNHYGCTWKVEIEEI